MRWRRASISAAMWRRVFRLRTLLYTALLVVITVAAGVSLYLRNPLKVDVMRDRGALAREAEPGVVENVYRLQVMNTDETPRQFTVTADGPPRHQGRRRRPADRRSSAASSRLVPLRAAGAAREAGAEPATATPHQRSHKVEIVVEAIDDPKVAPRGNELPVSALTAALLDCHDCPCHALARHRRRRRGTASAGPGC